MITKLKIKSIFLHNLLLQPLAVSMIGGMSLSMLLSLPLIPKLYWVVNGKRIQQEDKTSGQSRSSRRS